MLAGVEKDRQRIGRTVDKMAGPTVEVAQSLPIPSAMGQLEQATGFLEQVLETLECRLGTVLTATDSAIGGAVAESSLDECALSGSIARQARRVRGSSERLLDILNRLAL